MKTRLLVSAATGLLALTQLAVAQVANGGFEAGSFAGWTYTGNTGSSATSSLIARDPLLMGQQAPFSGEWGPEAGDFFAALWSTDSIGMDGASLSQQFVALAGETLEFDVFYDFGDFAPSSDGAIAQLRFDGQLLTLAAFNMDVTNLLPDDTNVNWTHYSYVLPSSSTGYELSFVIADSDGTFESIIGIDNVTIIPAPAGGLVLLGGMMAARRRTR